MAAPSSISKSYVEVYIWLAKDEDGYTTTSSEGGRQEPKKGGSARCGHVSMGIFPENQPSAYVSFWPKDNIKANSFGDIPGELLDNIGQDQDAKHERTDPDIIVRLHRLTMETMIAAFDYAKVRVANGELKWGYMAISNNDYVTDPAVERASCASFVYTFLKIGGFAIKDHIYYQNVRSTGPSGEDDFYRIMKCTAGDRWGGYFNFAPWTNWFFSPKALLLRTASAAEAVPEDKAETIKIMQSNRVAKEKVRV